MSTNNSSTYPPPSTFAGPTQYAGGSHEQYPGPSQGYPPPECTLAQTFLVLLINGSRTFPARNARNNSGFMSPPNVPRPHPSSSLSAHDHPLYHQPTHGPVGNPTIRMPQVQATPSYASSALPLTDETSGEIMYMADPLNNIQPAPVPSLNYPLQAPVLSYPPSQHRGPGGVSGNVHISPHVQGYRARVPLLLKYTYPYRLLE